MTSSKTICNSEGPDSKFVLEVTLSFNRSIPQTLMDVGQSIAIFPQNSTEDVDQILQAFNWDPSILFGNLTTKEMLSIKIDIRTKPLNFVKLGFPDLPKQTLLQLAKTSKVQLPISLIESLPKI